MKKHQLNKGSIKLLTEEQLLKIKGGERPLLESAHHSLSIRWDEVILRFDDDRDDRNGGSQRNNNSPGTNSNHGIIKF